MRWALVPAKLGPQSKRRLAPHLAPERRHLLAEGMLDHVLATLAGIASLDGIAAIGRGDALAAAARTPRVTPLAETAAANLNEAVAEGAAFCAARGATAVLVAMADLPLLDAAEVESLLDALPARGIAIAPSRDGTGTNLLAFRPPLPFATAFGPGSLALHFAAARAAGLEVACRRLPGAALDLDTPEDLARFVATAGPDGGPRRGLVELAATSSAPSASRSR